MPPAKSSTRVVQIKLKKPYSCTKINIIGCGLLLISGCAGPLFTPDGPGIALEQASGRVLVIRDAVYVIAQPGLVLQPGDRVVTREDAEAVIRYRPSDEAGEAGGCVLAVPPAHQLVIGDATDCASNERLVPVRVDGAVEGATAPED